MACQRKKATMPDPRNMVFQFPWNPEADRLRRERDNALIGWSEAVARAERAEVLLEESENEWSAYAVTLNQRLERAEALLADMTDEIRSLIDRGVIGQGWAATHLPKFYVAREALAAVREYTDGPREG